jgi:hypothetical protein
MRKTFYVEYWSSGRNLNLRIEVDRGRDEKVEEGWRCNGIVLLDLPCVILNKESMLRVSKGKEKDRQLVTKDVKLTYVYLGFGIDLDPGVFRSRCLA